MLKKTGAGWRRRRFGRCGPSFPVRGEGVAVAPSTDFPCPWPKRWGCTEIYITTINDLGWGCVSNVFWVRVKTKPMIFTDVPQEWRVWRYNQQICSPNVLIWKPLVGWPHWQTDAPLDATWTDLDGLGSSLHLVKWIAVTFWISPSLVVSITVFGRLRIS